MVIIGAETLVQALANYEEFENSVFIYWHDVNPKLIGLKYAIYQCSILKS